MVLGLKRENLYARNSTGLRNMKNNLKLFNGQIKISSQKGKGSHIMVQLPLLVNPEPGFYPFKC